MGYQHQASSDNDPVEDIIPITVSNFQWYIDGLVQERRNSIAKALDLHLSCINPDMSHMLTKQTPYLLPLNNMCYFFPQIFTKDTPLLSHVDMAENSRSYLNPWYMSIV